MGKFGVLYNINVHLWQLVAYYKWSHMEVRLYVTHLLHKAQEFF